VTSGGAGGRGADAVAPTVRPPSTWNVANGLTALRIALVPVFAALLLHGEGRQTSWRVAAFVAFAVASLTDRFDGELARRHGLVTDLGKIADPIADKALTGTALVGLSALGELPWWVTILVLAREAGVTALRFAVIRHGVLPASRGGKLKTSLQVLAIGLYVLPLAGATRTVAEVVMALAVVVTVVTGVDYGARAARLRRTSPRALARRRGSGRG
jgi:CDP-diacylglycerol---glycerol-3-phosphate 3-phosphatidyltransferase